jgi:hypothetical protein
MKSQTTKQAGEKKPHRVLSDQRNAPALRKISSLRHGIQDTRLE